jgi:hypothetical protein
MVPNSLPLHSQKAFRFNRVGLIGLRGTARELDTLNIEFDRVKSSCLIFPREPAGDAPAIYRSESGRADSPLIKGGLGIGSP